MDEMIQHITFYWSGKQPETCIYHMLSIMMHLLTGKQLLHLKLVSTSQMKNESWYH